MQKSFPELRKELAAVQRTFLEADLAIAATIAEIAARHYKEGNPQDGNRCKGESERAIQTVRYFISSTDLLTGAEAHVLARRCNKLERIVSTLKEKNRGPARRG
jgi:hypothetical protein